MIPFKRYYDSIGLDPWTLGFTIGVARIFSRGGGGGTFFPQKVDDLYFSSSTSVQTLKVLN